MIITLDRAHMPDGSATIGKLEAGGFECYTIERPWLANAQKRSCIPGGWYTLRKRESPIVRRTTHGDYNEGWEVCNVPGRSYIMIHVANWASDVLGCIGPGDAIAWTRDKGFMVTNSQATFRNLMRALSGEAEHTLIIRG